MQILLHISMLSLVIDKTDLVVHHLFGLPPNGWPDRRVPRIGCLKGCMLNSSGIAAMNGSETQFDITLMESEKDPSCVGRVSHTPTTPLEFWTINYPNAAPSEIRVQYGLFLGGMR